MIRPTHRWIFSTLTIGAVLGIGLGLWPYFSAPAESARITFSMPGMDGENHRARDYRGRVLIINFWASWCLPCRRETPRLIAAQKRFGPRGLQTIGVAVDRVKPARRFATRYGINYPVLIGAARAARLQDRYTQNATMTGILPFTLIVNREGEIVHRSIGELTQKRLIVLISPLLDDHRP